MEPPEEEEKPEIWTPPEKLDDSTKRLALMLFLEVWKARLAKTGEIGSSNDDTANHYGACLRTAKIVRRLEQG